MLGQKNTFLFAHSGKFPYYTMQQSERPYYKWFGFTNIILVITKGYRVRATTIKVKTLLLHCCALRKFHVTDSQNTRDHITSERRSKRA